MSIGNLSTLLCLFILVHLTPRKHVPLLIISEKEIFSICNSKYNARQQDVNVKSNVYKCIEYVGAFSKPNLKYACIFGTRTNLKQTNPRQYQP